VFQIAIIISIASLITNCGILTGEKSGKDTPFVESTAEVVSNPSPTPVNVTPEAFMAVAGPGEAQEMPLPAAKLNQTDLNAMPPAAENTADQPADPGAAVAAQSASAPPQPPEKPEVGFSAPEFTLLSINGDKISMSDLRGKNIILNYWVTWCIPCKEEMPTLQKIHQEYSGKDLVVLSVDGIKQDHLETVKSLLEANHLTFPVVLDEGDTIYQSYHIGFLPTTIFIDEFGIIRHIMLGGAPDDQFHSLVNQLLEDKF
jgi:peroxiredoxin